MFIMVCFIHVCMDKHIQATKKVLESFFVFYVPIVTFVPLLFSNVYACIL